MKEFGLALALTSSVERNGRLAKTLFVTTILAVVACGNLLALWIKQSQLLIGFDGGYMMDLAQRQLDWRIGKLSSSMDFFQGLGDLFFAVNFTLLPSYMFGTLLPTITATKICIYAIVICEISAAIIFFGRALGASVASCVAAASITCLALFPFASPSLIYPIVPLVPHYGSFIASSLLIGAASISYGRRGSRADLLFIIIVLGLLSWSVLVSITSLLLSAPFLMLCAISGILAAATPNERNAKIILFVIVVLFILFAGPALYLASTILDTAAVVFPVELANDRATFFFASILFHWNAIGPVGPILMFGAIVGAILAIFDRDKPTMRIFAITLLTYLGTRLTFATLVVLIDFWRGPAALYFEFFVIPLYAIFAAYLLERSVKTIWSFRGWPNLSKTTVVAAIVMIEVAAALGLAVKTPSGDYGFIFPPKSNALASYLAAETGIRPGSIFRGRAANMTGRLISENVDWLTLHRLDGPLSIAIGNELRLVGLHYFGIPSLFEYTPTITPFLYVFTTRLLAVPGDTQMRNVLVLRKIDPRILRMIGVRFVVTDELYHGDANLRSSLAYQNRSLFLYEIADVNLGDYSPTQVRLITTASAIIDRLSQAEFEPRRELIVAAPEELPATLGKARNTKLTFLGSSLRIQSESDGDSVLLLPLEFSRCLEADIVDGERPRLFRANLLETGLVFSKKLDATLSIKTGPFTHPACRMQDLFDARALGIGQVPPLTSAVH
jgi:hypothetical protein